MFTAALIGCGQIGSSLADDPRFVGIQTHAGAFAAHEEIVFAGVCDTDPDRAANCGRRWGVTAFTDAVAMLEAIRPDIVSICTPDATHAALALQAMRTGHPQGLIIEKPLAQNLDAARELCREAVACGVIVVVNYSRRYAASHALLRERISSGEFGRIEHVGGYYGKGLLHTGTHWLDLARYLVGEIAWVEGRNLGCRGIDDPDYDVSIGFTGGTTGFLKACDARLRTIFEMDLIGDKGRLRIIESGLRYEVHVHDVAGNALRLDGVYEAGFADFLLRLVSDMVNALKYGTAPLCGAADGLRALGIADAIRLSARHGVEERIGFHEP